VGKSNTILKIQKLYKYGHIAHFGVIIVPKCDVGNFTHLFGTGVHLLLRQTCSGTTAGRIIFRTESCKNIQNSVSFTSSVMYCILVASWNATWQSVVDKTYEKYREFFFLVLT
jgi:hypothetical protein